MKKVKRTMALLALLLMGSASLPAQGSDPFPSVNVNKYADNMTILGQVRINGRVLGEETVVAVYQGDEIRGKGSPFSQDRHENIFYFNVYGDKNGEPLHFRVFTDGNIIEVDQGLAFTIDSEVGSPSSYYVVNLPAPVVTTFNGDGWATTCLPFKAKVPDGVKVWDVTGIAGGIVQKELLPGTVLPANTPVLLQGSGDGSCKWSATVADVSITRASESILRGTLTEMKVYAYRDLTLGYSNANPPQVGFWPVTGDLEANRAYILSTAGKQGGELTDDGQTTLIRDLEAPTQTENYYDLMGRKTTLRKGQILISKGRKILLP